LRRYGLASEAIPTWVDELLSGRRYRVQHLICLGVWLRDLDDPRHASLGEGFGYRQPTEAGNQRIRWSPHAHYGLGITDSVGTFLGHNGAIPGFQTLIGYEPQTGTTIVVFANNQLEPNTAFVLPGDTIAGIIQKALFP
jgi:hypothetical protein